MEERKTGLREEERLLSLAEIVEAAERAKIPLKIDKPGFTRIMVDMQEQLRRPFAAEIIPKAALKLGIASITY